MLEVRNIAFTYSGKPVLKDVGFVVSPGETVAIVGGNGVGKTTLLRILATLAVPESGQVIIDGVDAMKSPLRYRRQLGYLPEKISLYEDLTVRGYLEYRAFLKGEPAKRIRRRLGEASEMCRIGDLMNKPIGRLSAGMKKRVALADAFLLRPRVLLLDDFLVGLDSVMRRMAGEILAAAAAFSSVIATGHEIDDLARWATRFLVLRDGVIAHEQPTAGMERAALTARLDALLAGGGVA